jgi:hypothetical protein
MENMRHAQPREFWKLFARKRKNQCTIATEDFFQYFSGLQANMSSVSDDVAEQFCASNDFDVDSCNFEELDRPITVAEIESAIRSLKRNKVCAGDQLLNEYFIESCDILSSHLADVFNTILNCGFFPDQWSEGIVVPLLKKVTPMM